MSPPCIWESVSGASIEGKRKPTMTIGEVSPRERQTSSGIKGCRGPLAATALRPAFKFSDLRRDECLITRRSCTPEPSSAGRMDVRPGERICVRVPP